MKTITEHLSARRAERRAVRYRRAAGVTLLASLAVIAALVLGAALLKAARLSADIEAGGFCEGEVCADPAW